MAKSKKKLVELKTLDYLDLIKIVKSKSKKKQVVANDAYNEIERRIKPKIMYIISQFYIPGCNSDDVCQEALFALRFKAIPDYDPSRGNFGPYPFDNFAILCIRRHLSTLLKSSFQNKKKALNTSISLDKNRNRDSVDMLFLVDIITDGNSSISDELQDKEYYVNLFSRLLKKLSKFERKVFILYTHKYSYEEITKIINDNYKSKKMKKRINVKGVDNALSRIKIKGKITFEKFDKKRDEKL
jgi:RNA polymerase sporulation-specific sigma factor